MAANSDRTLAVQPPLATGLASTIVEDTAVMHKQAIWDELFITRVFFALGTGLKTCVNWIEKSLEISIDVGIESLKVAQLPKEEGWNNQNVLDHWIGNGICWIDGHEHLLRDRLALDISQPTPPQRAT